MGINSHIAGHTDPLGRLVAQVSKLSAEVATLKRVVGSDALKVRGYHLEVRPEAEPAGLYIVKTNHEDRSTHGEEATFICP